MVTTGLESSQASLVLANWHSVQDDLDKLDPYLSDWIPLYVLGFDRALDFELNHLKRSPNGATDDLRVAKIVQLAVLRELHEIGQRVGFQDERKLVERGVPIGHTGRDTEKHFEAKLGQYVGRFPEIAASSDLWRTSEKVLDHSHAHIVADEVELFVDLVTVLVVLDELGYEGAISEREKLVGYLPWIVDAKPRRLLAAHLLESVFVACKEASKTDLVK